MYIHMCNSAYNDWQNKTDTEVDSAYSRVWKVTRAYLTMNKPAGKHRSDKLESEKNGIESQDIFTVETFLFPYRR